ncbi:TPA: restriction endonuclease subunit S [Enterococcus faecium]|nr:restriction endonuclease subunit S [Enterococcus hirae]
MSKDKQPEIRFPGFTEDWEQRKLGEIVRISSGFTGDSSLNIGQYELTRIETIATGQVNLNKVGYSNTEPDKKYLLDKGDILFSNINSLSHIGKIALFDLDMKLYHGINLLRLQPMNVNSQFLYQSFQLNNHLEWAKSHANQAVSQASINQTELSKQVFLLPSQQEQQKIGTFFKQLDDTIALHQRKLDLLKETKKGFLQKMFPKNGAKVPEIRFPDFTGDWEQRKLGDIFKKDTQKNKDLEFNSDSVISVAKMKLSTPSAKSSDEYMKTYNKIWKGNIAFEGHTNDEFPNGRFVLNDCQDGIVSHIYDVYSAVDEYDNEFMKRYINNPYVMRKILINATSSARMMKSLNSVEFLKQSILLPILSEQQKIGGFFYQLDNIIALHQRKLDLLKETKKGFLQKMFV